MDSYEIFETNEYIKNIEKIECSGKKIKNKIVTYVYPQLRNNPYYGKNIKKLRDYKPDTWRYRIGGYRLFYEISEKERLVYMTVADTRSSSY
ncbi:MAG: type II toxin-antitoxin system RelE/ParE family toxin [Candidatus Hydrogenedentota bacterium]